MREKVILQDFTILLICTSNNWSTIERRVLFDATYLRNIGCNPFIFCQKGSQIDQAAEVEDIPRIYISSVKVNWYVEIKFLFELRKLINERRFDIIHCYSLSSIWKASLILRSNHKVPLFFTLNHNIKSAYQGSLARWLFKRIDVVFTLSEEVKEFVEETTPISSRKVKNIGGGLEVLKRETSKESVSKLGCIINDLSELKRLRSIIKMFRVLKSHSKLELQHLELFVFLGPRVYQKDSAKKLLTEFDYEFYEGDIQLYSLVNRAEELKQLDVYIGTAFDEPLNDFEIISIMNEIPVLFPRTAVRQNLLFKYKWVGESYFEGDIREGKSKLEKIIENYSIYRNALNEYAEEIALSHGIDAYAEKFQLDYEVAFSKRRRFSERHHE